MLFSVNLGSGERQMMSSIASDGVVYGNSVGPLELHLSPSSDSTKPYTIELNKLYRGGFSRKEPFKGTFVWPIPQEKFLPIDKFTCD